METKSELLRILGRVPVMAYYDHQAVRTQSKNRIRDIIWRRDSGIPFNARIEKRELKDRALGEYSDEKIDETLSRLQREGKITAEERDYIAKIYYLADHETEIETSMKKEMMSYIETEPIYLQFLKRVKGIGPVLGAGLIHRLGYCERFDTVSRLWAFSGLHVVDGHAVKRARGEKLNFDIRLRTLCWKVADSFVKQRTPYFRLIYDMTKNRELSRTDENKPKSRMHAENRARRKMVKIFLQGYWGCARELAGLPTRPPYVQEKLGHDGIVSWREMLGKEDL